MTDENGNTPQGDLQVSTPAPTSDGATANTSSQGKAPTPLNGKHADQAKKMVSDALAVQGREHKAVLAVVVDERDAIKAQLTAVKGELEDVVSERERLNTRLTELASDDPEIFNLMKAEGELRIQQAELQSGRYKLEADINAHIERINLANDTLREMDIFDIANARTDGDPVRLKEVCATAGVTDREQIEKMAATIWPDAATPNPGAATNDIPYSGITSGGGANERALTGTAAVTAGLRKLNK